MKRTIDMTPTATQALWSRLSDQSLHIPTQFLIEGSAKDGGYDISAVDVDLCGFKVIGLRSYYAVREFISQVNSVGSSAWDHHVETSTYAWKFQPLPTGYDNSYFGELLNLISKSKRHVCIITDDKENEVVTLTVYEDAGLNKKMAYIENFSYIERGEAERDIKIAKYHGYNLNLLTPQEGGLHA